MVTPYILLYRYLQVAGTLQSRIAVLVLRGAVEGEATEIRCLVEVTSSGRNSGIAFAQKQLVGGIAVVRRETYGRKTFEEEAAGKTVVGTYIELQRLVGHNGLCRSIEAVA